MKSLIVLLCVFASSTAYGQYCPQGRVVQWQLTPYQSYHTYQPTASTSSLPVEPTPWVGLHNVDGQAYQVNVRPVYAPSSWAAASPLASAAAPLYSQPTYQEYERPVVRTYQQPAYQQPSIHRSFAQPRGYTRQCGPGGCRMVPQW